MAPLVRRALLVAATGGAFALLLILGLGLGAVLSPGESAPPEPPLVAVRPRTPAPPPPPEPPPRPVVVETAPVVREAPAPEPVPQPELLNSPWRPGGLPLPTRLQLRRQLIRALGGLKEELGRCPATPAARGTPGARAALVLDLSGDKESVRVMDTRLEADAPVNDAFVSCARAALLGRTLVATSVRDDVHLNLWVPLGPGGNSLSFASASLSEPGALPTPPR